MYMYKYMYIYIYIYIYTKIKKNSFGINRCICGLFILNDKGLKLISMIIKWII